MLPCWGMFIQPLGAAATADFKKAAYKCAADNIMLPPRDDPDAFRKCMIEQLTGVAKDALAKFSCCLLPNWQGGSVDPTELTKNYTNCQQVCDWNSCLGFASSDFKKALIGCNFQDQACYTKCQAQPDWTKW